MSDPSFAVPTFTLVQIELILYMQISKWLKLAAGEGMLQSSLETEEEGHF